MSLKEHAVSAALGVGTVAAGFLGAIFVGPAASFCTVTGSAAVTRRVYNKSPLAFKPVTMLAASALAFGVLALSFSNAATQAPVQSQQQIQKADGPMLQTSIAPKSVRA